MTVQSNLDAAVVDLKAELDSMSFLDPGSKIFPDQEFIDTVQADMDVLVADYSAVFKGDWDGRLFTPTAKTLAHWLFDEEDHTLIIEVSPTNDTLVFRSVVPFPWRA